MLQLRHPVTAALCGLALLLAVAGPVPAEDDLQSLDRIVCVVNDGVVLESELEFELARVRQRLQREDRDIPPADVLRERVLEELVLQKIQHQRAARAGITVDDAAVNSALRDMAARYGTDLDGLRERMAAQGIPFDRLRADIRDRLIRSRLQQREVASQIQISQREVDIALDRVERVSDQRTEYHLRHILIGLPSEPTTEQVEQARKRAEGVVERLRDGADFATLTARVSDGPEALSGGDLGWRAGTSLPTLFLDAIEKMDPGELSPPLRSPNGFHVLKLVDRRGGQTATVTEVRARHIMLGGDGEADPRARLAELRRRIQSGADFGDLARAHSEHAESARNGGDLGWIGPGEMPPAFRQVVAGLPPGQLSEPFRTPLGWHIAKVIDKREREDVEEYRRMQVRQELYRRELEQETQRWLQRIRDSAYIDTRLSGQS